jgi:hypothetical protein
MNAACEVTFQQPDHEITQFFFTPMQINLSVFSMNDADQSSPK